MTNFTPQEIEQFLEEFFDVVGKRQYIGARYVPIFGRKGEDSIEWDNSAAYEPLTVVMHQGISYVSKQYVPADVEITDETYWAETYRFNAQVEQYRQEVLSFQGQIDDRVPFPDPDLYPRYGSQGQVLETLADGTTRWTDPVVPSDEQAEAVITAWLVEHPEATTTVQDGAITTPKLHDGAVTDAKLAPTGLISRVQTYRSTLAASDDIDALNAVGCYYLVVGTPAGTMPPNIATGQRCLLFIDGTGNLVTQRMVGLQDGHQAVRGNNVAAQLTYGSWEPVPSSSDLADIDATFDATVTYRYSLPQGTNVDAITEMGVFYYDVNNLTGTLPDDYDATTSRTGLLVQYGTGNFVTQEMHQFVTGYGWVRTAVDSGGQKSFSPWVREWTKVDATLSQSGVAADAKAVGDIVRVPTSNLWPFEADVETTDSIIKGTLGMQAIAPGTYTLSFDLTSTAISEVLVYYGNATIASNIIAAAPDGKEVVMRVTAPNGIERVLFRVRPNNTGTLHFANIQVTDTNWYMYSTAPSTGSWVPVPYAPEYVAHTSCVDAEARQYPSMWRGKTINYNGDSVTHGTISTGLGYVQVVNRLLDFGTANNYAIGGTRLAHVDDVPNCLVDRYQDMTTDCDVVFIMANTNDYASQVPLGAADSTDPTTYNGALNVILSWLKSTYLTQPIIISTMLTRKVNYDPVTGEPLPITIEQYAQCVRDRVADHGLILYDAYRLSGMDLRTSPTDGTGITDDGLHPNAAGAQALGRKVAAFINAQ